MAEDATRAALDELRAKFEDQGLMRPDHPDTVVVVLGGDMNGIVLVPYHPDNAFVATTDRQVGERSFGSMRLMPEVENWKMEAVVKENPLDVGYTAVVFSLAAEPASSEGKTTQELWDAHPPLVTRTAPTTRFDPEVGVDRCQSCHEFVSEPHLFDCDAVAFDQQVQKFVEKHRL